MHVRVISQKSKAGHVRKYTQIVKSVRRADGMPATKVVAHLGAYDPVLTANLRAAFAAARFGKTLDVPLATAEDLHVDLWIKENLVYLPLALVSHFFRLFGLDDLINQLIPRPPRAAAAAAIIEALVAHRCLEPGSKLAFQRWTTHAAIAEVVGVNPARLNNTRVHRVLDQLAAIEHTLQEMIAGKIVARGRLRVLYLDLTDTWFEAGGGPLARRGQTKQGHRSKWKIHIALLVNEQGLPMRWSLLPGALSETTVLPAWVDYVKQRPCLEQAVLIFDRGMPSAENFLKLVGDEELVGDNGGHLFLTSVKSDAIPTYASIDQDALNTLQVLPNEATANDVAAACAAIGMQHFRGETYARDLGVVTPPAPRTKRRVRPPRMRMFLYFNREIQRTKRTARNQKIDRIHRFVAELNEELQLARQPRKADPTRRKVTRLIERLQLLELFDVRVTSYNVQGRTKLIASQQITLTLREDMYCNIRRYDGISLLVGHPKLDMNVHEAIAAYRQKDAVEADFRTIKSVLKVRPTFHWTETKIRSHVIICILALLIERLIEEKLEQCSLPAHKRPQSADALLKELRQVSLDRLLIDDRAHTVRTEASDRTKSALDAVGANDLLDVYPSTLKIPVKA